MPQEKAAVPSWVAATCADQALGTCEEGAYVEGVGWINLELAPVLGPSQPGLQLISPSHHGSSYQGPLWHLLFGYCHLNLVEREDLSVTAFLLPVSL